MTPSEMEVYARENFVPIMSATTREVLTAEVKKARPEKILEIGTAIGYSGVVMLTACPTAHLYSIEISEERAQLARNNFAENGFFQNVTLFCGDAMEIVPNLSGSYDFVFMDGPKGQYATFLPYIDKLLRRGGVLVCDDALYKVENSSSRPHKHDAMNRNMDKFLKMLTDNTNYRTTVYESGDGVSVSYKK